MVGEAVKAGELYYVQFFTSLRITETLSAAELKRRNLRLVHEQTL